MMNIIEKNTKFKGEKTHHKLSTFCGQNIDIDPQLGIISS